MVGVTAVTDVLTSVSTVTPVPSIISKGTSYVSATTTISGVHTITASDVNVLIIATANNKSYMEENLCRFLMNHESFLYKCFEHFQYR